MGQMDVAQSRCSGVEQGGDSNGIEETKGLNGRQKQVCSYVCENASQGRIGFLRQEVDSRRAE